MTDEIKDLDTIDIKDIRGGEAKTREEYDKDAGEVDLYTYVTNALKEAGCPNYENWDHGRIPVEELRKEPMSLQREIVNRALRLKLGESPKDTRDHRYLLIDDGSLEEWQDNIKTPLNFIVNMEKENEQTNGSH